MKCPFCGADDTKVIDSRDHQHGAGIKRRRKCVECDERFTTFEHIAVPPRVVKRDGTKVAYDQEKVARGIRHACSKRPLTDEQLEGMVARIEAEMSQSRLNHVESRRIGELVMEQLRAFDQVAYLRFASVYGEFKDLSDFQEAIEPMLTGAED